MPRESLHGVVVSDGYADYLDVTLGQNRPMLDRCVVATHPEDKETIKVAAKHNCEVTLTESGRDEGGFNKGKMIDRALLQLPHTGWRIHFDADIAFPGNMLTRLDVALYDRQAIYGADRMNVVNWDGWQKLVNSGFAARGFEYQHYLLYSLNKAEIGSRLIYGDLGYVPIGYFQLWHSDAEFLGEYRVRSYSVTSNNAAHDDVQFALRWDRHHRILIPEFLVAHLVNDDISYGKNWGKRVTKKFCPVGSSSQVPTSCNGAS
jgi:hypothetical protein